MEAAKEDHSKYGRSETSQWRFLDSASSSREDGDTEYGDDYADRKIHDLIRIKVLELVEVDRATDDTEDNEGTLKDRNNIHSIEKSQTEREKVKLRKD